MTSYIMSITLSEQDTRSFLIARGERDDDDNDDTSTTSDDYRHKYSNSSSHHEQHSCEDNNNDDHGHDNHQEHYIHHETQHDSIDENSGGICMFPRSQNFINLVCITEIY
jgi:hypothetical protein